MSSTHSNNKKRSHKSQTGATSRADTSDGTTTSGKSVAVFKCPSAFPISTNSRKRPRRISHKDEERPSSFTSNNQKTNKINTNNKLLDWHETAKEIRAYGATAFVGKQKRDYEDEQYFQLTGRHKKKPKTPLPLVRALKKAADKREAKAREEARQAGIILPTTSKEEKKKKMESKADSAYRNHGPAPSIGFMKNGMYRVSNPPKRQGKGR